MDILHLVFVRTLNLAGFTNCEIQRDLDSSGRLSARQPPARMDRNTNGFEAEAMLTAIGGAESKPAGRTATLCYNSVVVIENFFDGNVDTELGWLNVVVGLLRPAPRFVVTYKKAPLEICDTSGSCAKRWRNIGIESSLITYRLRACQPAALRRNTSDPGHQGKSTMPGKGQRAGRRRGE